MVRITFFVSLCLALAGCMQLNRKSIGEKLTDGGDSQSPSPQVEACSTLKGGVLADLDLLGPGQLFFNRILTDDAGNVVVSGNGNFAINEAPAVKVARFDRQGNREVLSDYKNGYGGGGLAVAGDVILVSGSRYDAQTLQTRILIRRSADRGRTWTNVEERDYPSAEFGTAPDFIRLEDGHIWLLKGRARRSTDLGLTWADMPSPAPSQTLVGLARDPSGALYSVFHTNAQAMNRWVVHKSIDSGATWTEIDNVPGVASSIWSDSSGALYAFGTSLGNNPSQLLRRSVDGGVTWVESTLTYRVDAVDRAGTFYASEGITSPGNPASYFRSVDSGATWAKLGEIPPAQPTAYTQSRVDLDQGGNAFVFGWSYDLGAAQPYLKGRLAAIGAILPSKLSASCLSSAAVSGFEPRYPLWSDGAAKKRSIYLPPGTQIDTSNMDEWVFPVGTRIWKEFERDGKKVETRVLVKTYPGEGQSAWRAAVYRWRDDQSDADLSFDAVNGALGTPHRIPSANQCMTCHRGSRDIALGFDALQLSGAPIAGGKLSLQSLADKRLISTATPPSVDIQGSTNARAALGYMHSNCASCHNPRGSMPAFNLKHSVAATSLNTENAFVATVTGGRVVPRDPAASRVLIRMGMRPGGMPSIGTDLTDAIGMQAIADWINELP